MSARARVPAKEAGWRYRFRQAARWRLREGVDRLLAADPGLNRLSQALQIGVGVAASIGVEYLFMHATHAMWASAPPGHRAAGAVAAQHRGITLLAMLLGGMVAMISTLGAMDATPGGQALTLALEPLPMLAAMAVSIELSRHRTVGLVVMALVIGLGVYMRRFVAVVGPRAVLYGMLLFMGYFFGFMAGAEIHLADLGWVALILWVAVATNLALKLIVYRPFDRRGLERTRASFVARGRRVMGCALALFETAPGSQRSRLARRLDRQVARLNETALMIDAQLADPLATLRPASARWTRERVFDIELATQNAARIVARLPGASLPAPSRQRVGGWLRGLWRGGRAGRDAAEDARRALEDGNSLGDLDPPTAAQLRALARMVSELDAAVEAWGTNGPQDAQDAEFESPVRMMGGSLAGTAQLSAAAAAPEARGGLAARLHLDPSAQTAIRVALAVGAAAAAGSALSERRFYWAVIAVFIAFMGANTTAEQIAKAAQRLVGTFVGILVGSLIAQALGPTPWSIPIIIASLALGVYFRQVNYGLMAAGTTIMVAQLYVQLGEYSWSLLVLRLEATAVGAAIAALAALLIFPVPARTVARTATVRYLEALEGLLDTLERSVAGERDGRPDPAAAARALDDALRQLESTVQPLAWTPTRRDELGHNLALVRAVSRYAHNLARAVPGADADGRAAGAQQWDGELRQRLAAAIAAEREGVRELAQAIEESRGAEYRRHDEVLVELDRGLGERGEQRAAERADQPAAERANQPAAERTDQAAERAADSPAHTGRWALRALIGIEGMLAELTSNLSRGGEGSTAAAA